jgi:hypothetical protein
MKRLETKQAVLQACQQLRQATEDRQAAQITASILIAMRNLPMDDALEAVANDALHLGMCLVERPGALQRLQALTGGRTAFVQSDAA